MQNPGITEQRTLGYSKPEANSEPCQTSTMEHCATIFFTNYNYFCSISFSRSLLSKFNKGQFLAPKVFILCKKHSGPEGQGP